MYLKHKEESRNSQTSICLALHWYLGSGTSYCNHGNRQGNTATSLLTTQCCSLYFSALRRLIWATPLVSVSCLAHTLQVQFYSRSDASD